MKLLIWDFDGTLAHRRGGAARGTLGPFGLLVVFGPARQRRDGHAPYTASRASISAPWS